MSKHTILFAEHESAGAVLIDFAGWIMPLRYGSQIYEHEQVRKIAGMFDVSHMGIIDICGPQSQDFLAYLLANDIQKLSAPGKALYSCMLNDRGGVIDDLIVYYLSSNFYRLVVNASTTTKDFAWIQQHAVSYKVKIILRTDLAIIAVQGPLAISKVCNIVKISLPRFGCITDNNWLFARTGYTGEDGLEIILPNQDAVALWQNLRQQGVIPVGLGARDTLRLEAGLNLYGNDMDDSVTPLESNLSWTVAMEPNARNFIGREALKQQLTLGLKRQLVGLVLLDKGILRHGQRVFSDRNEVGVITSGTFAPTLHRSIGLARVALPLNKDYVVEIRGKMHSVSVVSPPFVKKGTATFSL